MFQSTSEVLQWLDSRKAIALPKVESVSLAKIDSWTMAPDTDCLSHITGRFFRIIGSITKTPSFTVCQPLIEQPEVGVLGILAKKFEGRVYYLMQAKAEPGNINGIQLSPTVQATKSNYFQVHKGLKTKYLEYFLDRSKVRILFDQLQSEQNSFFYKKRNRNMIVETEDVVEVHPDYCWVSRAQIQELLKLDNIVNMDSRSVLSCLHETGAPEEGTPLHSIIEIQSWLAEAKSSLEMETKVIGLREMSGWQVDKEAISPIGDQSFSVIGVSFSANAREIKGWSQPLIAPKEFGLNVFFTRTINGVRHYLVQAKVEPGTLDGVELGPSLQYLPGGNWNLNEKGELMELATKAPAAKVIFNAIHSEEGGRFYHYQNRYMIVEIDRDVEIDSRTHLWMSHSQITAFLQFSNLFNMEARSLISCIPGVARK